MSELRKLLTQDVINALCTISCSTGLTDILTDSIEAYKVSENPEEFRFLMNKMEYMFDISMSTINEDTQKEIHQRVNNESHQSELWRQAVISATNSKHPDPISFADKVLASYNEKFTIFA
jgi:hypothetical protein